MNVKVYFEITFKDVKKELIVSRIKTMGYQFLPYELGDYGEGDIEPNQMMCLCIIPKKEAYKHLEGKITSLYQLDGLTKVKIFQTSEIPVESKKRWYEHFLTPLIIAAIIGILNGLTIIWSLPVGLNAFDYIKVLFVPTIISFCLPYSYCIFEQKLRIVTHKVWFFLNVFFVQIINRYGSVRNRSLNSL